MNPIIKKQWADALRSGQYKQCKQVLHVPHTNQYCVLGVLTSLYIQAHSHRAGWKKYDGDTQQSGFQENGVASKVTSLPNSVRVWAGLKHSTPFFKRSKEKQATNLLSSNDKGVDFKKLADIIEFGDEV